METRVEELLRLLDANPELREALQERIVDERAILRVLEKRAETREAIRRQILQDEFLQLPGLIRELIEAQQRTEAQTQENSRLIRELIETQQRHEAILQEHARQLQSLTALVQRIVEAQEQIMRDVHTIEKWRRGFEGLQKGMALEQQVRRRASTLFMGGRGGGADSPAIRAQLRRWIRTLPNDGSLLPAEADPTAAHLIWSKGGKIIVVEVSVQVDREDVRRAHQRAETLRRAQLDAVPVVIGEEWAFESVQELAQSLGVEWYVEGKLSEGFIALRRLPDNDEEDA